MKGEARLQIVWFCYGLIPQVWCSGWACTTLKGRGVVDWKNLNTQAIAMDRYLENHAYLTRGEENKGGN